MQVLLDFCYGQMSSIWARTKPHLWWSDVVELPEVTWPEITSPEVTWPEVTSITWLEAVLTGTVSDRVRMRNRYILNYNYSSSTVVPMRMTNSAIGSDVIRRGLPCVCACTNGSCAIFTLMGPFAGKWRHHPWGFPWKLEGCSLWRPRLISCMATGTIPYYYLPLSLHFIFIITLFISIITFLTKVNHHHHHHHHLSGTSPSIIF